MWRLRIFLLIIGGFLIFEGCQESKLASQSASEPLPITLAELEANGPGDSVYRTVGDFLAIDWDYVYVEKKRSSKWDEVWVPAVPLYGEFANGPYTEWFELSDEERANGAMPVPKSVRTILRLSDAEDGAAVDAAVGGDTMVGMVVTGVESLDREEEELLRSSYPDTDFGQCIIFEVGRSPMGSGGATLFIVAGVGCLLGVGVWTVLGLRGDSSDRNEDTAE